MFVINTRQLIHCMGLSCTDPPWYHYSVCECAVLPTPQLNRGIGLLLTPLPRSRNRVLQFADPIHCQCNFNGITRNWATCNLCTAVWQHWCQLSHISCMNTKSKTDSTPVAISSLFTMDAMDEAVKFVNSGVLTACNALSNVYPKLNDILQDACEAFQMQNRFLNNEILELNNLRQDDLLRENDLIE